MSEPARAVFLSYASQDAEAARRICHALRASGINVFLDQSELRGGDAWDQKIRHEIQDCVLFIPIVSQNTQGRLEGYFRHEWNLAIERTHHMAQEKPFLVPIVIDGTGELEAVVPDAFRAVQWTRLPGGETPSAFTDRIERLLLSVVSPTSARSNASTGAGGPAPRPRLSRLTLSVLAIFLVVFASWAISSLWRSKPTPPLATAFAPPPHSIAVLPFLNLSGDREQDYFSEGLTEELLNSLVEIDGLQVAARTSSFSFKEQPDIATVAHKLNVGTVLEGSVRRSSTTMRVTAQLIDATTGFHVWSKTYDRDLGDALKLQTEIATAVAQALKVSLLGDLAAKIELGGTHNSKAFDAYLRGAQAYRSIHEAKDVPRAIADFSEAIQQDPHYALAFAARSIALTFHAAEETTVDLERGGFEKARADARQSLALAPDLAEAHLALGFVSEFALDLQEAAAAYARAVALAPGDAMVLRHSGIFKTLMGHFDAGLAAIRRAVLLDPLARESHGALGVALYYARHYQDSLAALTEAISLDPGYKRSYSSRGLVLYALGDLDAARTSCEIQSAFWASQQCLAIVYEKLGRQADAEAELAKLKASVGDTAPYQYATVYAQWGNTSKALDHLEMALRERDTGLEVMRIDPLLDPVRHEPRFQAIERELKFPD